MQVPTQSIQGFSGSVAVGGLVLTSLLLLIGAFATSLFAAVDFLSHSPAWAIVVAVPVAALSYVVGLLTTAVAESLFALVGWVPRMATVQELQKIHRKNEFVIGRYLQLRQEAESLAGGSLALVVFALACLCASFAGAGWRPTLLSASAMCVVLAVGSCALSVSRYRAVSAIASDESTNEVKN